MSFRLEFELPGLPETTNEVLAMSLRTRMQRKKYWRSLVWAVTADKRPAKPIRRAVLTLTRFSSVRPDPDGLTSTFKHIIDGLVTGLILKNDRYENIGFPTYLWAPAAPKSGKVKILLEEIE